MFSKISLIALTLVIGILLGIALGHTSSPKMHMRNSRDNFLFEVMAGPSRRCGRPENNSRSMRRMLLSLPSKWFRQVRSLC